MQQVSVFFRYGLFGFVALLLALQSLVAAGFMPGQTQDGKVALVICSGIDQKTIYVNADETPEKAPYNQTKPCSFAMMSPTLHDAPVLMGTTAPIVYAYHADTEILSLITKANAVLWHSRGPPSDLS